MAIEQQESQSRKRTPMLSVDTCPVCQRSRFDPFQSVFENEHQLNYVICKSCGLVLQSPRMDQNELDEFYNRDYRIHQQATEDPIEKDLRMQEARAERTLALVEDDLRTVDRHLDIGSSSGALLRAFRSKYQCMSAGIEPGEAYREFSRAAGDMVYSSQQELLETERGNFDLISMMHVLEHLPHPIAALDQLRQNLLTKDGHLLIEVPNLYEHASFELAHLFAFSPRSLREILRRAGYRACWLRTHGSFRSPILKLYITALAVPENEANPPRRIYIPGPLDVGVRRKLGTIKREFFTRYWPDWTWQMPPS
jgi:SAM-dependent methyltransferase